MIDIDTNTNMIRLFKEKFIINKIILHRQVSKLLKVATQSDNPRHVHTKYNVY